MRVIVVDDSVIVREGLRRLLEAEGHQVVDAVARPEQVAAAVAATGPDAVILDIRMPPTYTDEGLQIAMSLRKSRPELGILVLSQYAPRICHPASGKRPTRNRVPAQGPHPGTPAAHPRPSTPR